MQPNRGARAHPAFGERKAAVPHEDIARRGVAFSTVSPNPGQPALIAADPIRSHLDSIRTMQNCIARLTPNADSVHLLAQLGADLEKAIGQASEVTTLHTVPEVAERLRLSEEAVRWNIRTGRLDAERVGREYRISTQALAGFVAKANRRGKA